MTILEATGATITPNALKKEGYYDITTFGAARGADPVTNTTAINHAIQAAAKAGGGTVLFPAGTFRTYTILLQSNVNLHLEEGCIIEAARTEVTHSYVKQSGEGGNYQEPEINLYAGLQDHGHSYFANSLVYGADLSNIMISGKGLFTGGRLEEASGILDYVLFGGDPAEPHKRDQNGHQGEWFGNKGIALVRCKNIVLTDFSITIGGHFAIIAEGVDNMYVDNILVDTTRDAFDIDCCQNVTIRHTTCNSLTDDGLCLKASYGAGIFMPTENVLIEDCTVSGYDAGSVYAKEYTRDKLVAEDRCGPTGRVKFGTESTCGYHQVTIRRVRFDRSRGFALEAVDCSSLTDVIFTDCELDNVSSSPIFIRAGERGRYPVTGNTDDTTFPALEGNVRIDQRNWILPNAKEYSAYPAKRYTPHYNRNKKVSVDGCSSFYIVENTDHTLSLNPANFTEVEGHYYLNTWDETSMEYKRDLTKEIEKSAVPLYANAVGTPHMATVSNIEISNVQITNADPRYPILLMGLTDSHLSNIVLKNIQVEYRGGITMEHAIEQRQLNTQWGYSQFHAKERVQNIPWLVNTFFLKNEGLLPRVSYDPDTKSWKEAPYNVPELCDVYPEPSNWGILPAYGVYARHVDGLTMENIIIKAMTPDGRHVCVFDDAKDITIQNMVADCDENLSPIVTVTSPYRRPTHLENVPEIPYFRTTVENLQLSDVMIQPFSINAEKYPAVPTPLVREIILDSPAPGTPGDSMYSYPTVAIPENGYTFRVPTNEYSLPLTVHRPYLVPIKDRCVLAGEILTFELISRDPASQVAVSPSKGDSYDEQPEFPRHSVQGVKRVLKIGCENLPKGAVLASNSSGETTFSWSPSKEDCGIYHLVFYVEDDILREKMTVCITVQKCAARRT